MEPGASWIIFKVVAMRAADLGDFYRNLFIVIILAFLSLFFLFIVIFYPFFLHIILFIFGFLLLPQPGGASAVYGRFPG